MSTATLGCPFPPPLTWGDYDSRDASSPVRRRRIRTPRSAHQQGVAPTATITGWTRNIKSDRGTGGRAGFEAGDGSSPSRPERHDQRAKLSSAESSTFDLTTTGAPDPKQPSPPEVRVVEAGPSSTRAPGPRGGPRCAPPPRRPDLPCPWGRASNRVALCPSAVCFHQRGIGFFSLEFDRAPWPARVHRCPPAADPFSRCAPVTET